MDRMESMVVLQVVMFLIYLPIIFKTLFRLAVCLHFGKSCSHSCGGGTRMKTRRCPVSPFYNGNNPCGDGQSEVTEACNQNPCLPDPEWTPWGKFILCSYNYFLNQDYLPTYAIFKMTKQT